LLGQFAQAHGLTWRKVSRHQPAAQTLKNHFLHLPANPFSADLKSALQLGFI
jgi:hypothetical protein